MPDVAGNKVSGLRGLSAFEELIIPGVAGGCDSRYWGNHGDNRPDSGDCIHDLTGIDGEPRTFQYPLVFGENRFGGKPPNLARNAKIHDRFR